MKVFVRKFSITCISLRMLSSNALQSTSDMICLISSPSRGIGFEFAKQLLERSNMQVLGLVRSNINEYSLELKDLCQKYPGRLQLIPNVDLENDQSLEISMEKIRSKISRLDLLLNVSGVLGDGSSTAGPERSLNAIDRNWLSKSMNVNLIGHVMVTKSLMPLLSQRLSNDVQRPPAKIVNLSARVGSISDNGYI